MLNTCLCELNCYIVDLISSDSETIERICRHFHFFFVVDNNIFPGTSHSTVLALVDYILRCTCELLVVVLFFLSLSYNIIKHEMTSLCTMLLIIILLFFSHRHNINN